VVRAVRERWPALPLQVDANSAYTPADAPVFQELDQFDLLLSG
jgi:O-succinylbenzoate synthase